MSSIYKSIIIMVTALIVGRVCGTLVERSRFANRDKEYHILKEIQRYALTILVPSSSALALWISKLDDVRFIAIPFIGMAFMIVANLFGRGASRLFSDRKQKAVIFGTTAFSNLGTMGRLATFTVLGEAAMGYLTLFRLTEMFFVIAVGFTTIRSIQSGEKVSNKNIFKSVKDPIIIATLLAVIIGLTLNFAKIPRPQVLDAVNEIIVPGISFIILFTLGYRLKVKKTLKYIKSSLLVGAIKLFALPTVIALLCLLVGLNKTSPVACMTIVLLAGMPPAFLSVTAAQLYDGDVDMANSILLICTGLMFAWLPLAGLILPMIFG